LTLNRNLLIYHQSDTADQFSDADLRDVAAAQLAVDRKIGQGPVPQLWFAIKLEPNGPDPLRLERASHRPCVRHSTAALPGCRVEFRMSPDILLFLAGFAMSRVRLF
jgi:hypothetical protein